MLSTRTCGGGDSAASDLAHAGMLSIAFRIQGQRIIWVLLMTRVDCSNDTYKVDRPFIHCLAYLLFLPTS